jgi:hypothetical protein
MVQAYPPCPTTAPPGTSQQRHPFLLTLLFDQDATAAADIAAHLHSSQRYPLLPSSVLYKASP